jgi:phospholipase/carboxylesterase
LLSVVSTLGVAESAPERMELGLLSAWVVPNRCSTGDGTRTIVLLHGYSTAGRRLRELAASYAAAHCARVVVPEGTARSRAGGHAWWRAPRAGWRPAPRGWSFVRDDMERARAQVLELFAALDERWAVPTEAIVLTGFSQGATLAADVLLSEQVPLGAVVCLSGRFGGNPRWEAASDTVPDVPALLAHGTDDRVAPFWGASRLRDALETRDAGVVWLPYIGGHRPTHRVSRRFHRALAEVLDGVSG